MAAEEAKTTMDKDLCILQEGKSSGSENEIVRSIGIEKISADAAEKLYENLTKMMAREENFQENYNLR